MHTFLQLLSFDFILRNSVYTSVLIGFACPLVGVFLVMRRLVFMGVALPQISSTGVAAAFSLPLWLGLHLKMDDAGSIHMAAYASSIIFTLTAILLLAFLERRGKGQPESRLGVAYVVTAALGILLLSKNPSGEIGWLDMLKGEVITISNFDLALTGITLSIILALLGLFHKELLLVSFDRTTALILRKNALFWDVLLYLMIGLTVSIAVLSVGPLIAFGFLLIPALISHQFANNIRQLSLFASLIGGVSALLGFWIAYRYDLPVGPTDVVLLGIFYLSAWMLSKFFSLLKVLSNERRISALKKASRIAGLWFVFTLFDLFVVRDWAFIVENMKNDRFLINYIATSLAFLCLIILITAHLMGNRKKRAVAFVILVAPVIVQLSYFSIYRKFVSAFGFRAFSEDPGMVFSLWIHNLNALKLTSALIFALFFITVSGKIKASFNIFTQCIAGFVFFTVLCLMTLSWYSVPIFQNSVLAYAGSFLEMAKQKSFATFQINKPVIHPAKTDKPLPDIIFIIGESTVLSHMGLFGYQRNTTPGLDRLYKEKKILMFDNCVSIGLQTRLSVPYMMTGLQGIDPQGYIYTCPTIFNYAKARGYNTAFITAQDFYWGGLKDLLIDNDVDDFENGTNFNPSISVHKGANDLDVLNKAILPYLETAKKPFLLVLQMDGSHYPFAEHCEKKYKVFLPETDPNGVDAFDNSVVYTDMYLTKLIETARATHPDCWIFFAPDHGQNLGGKNGFYNDNFSSDVIHNPLIISPPDNDYSAVNSNIHAPLSQSDLVPTMLDLMDLKPVKPLDGYSITGKIPEDRLRVCSTYMPTFHNVPEAVLVFNDLEYYFVDLQRKSVLLKDGKTMKKFDDMEPEYRNVFLRRM